MNGNKKIIGMDIGGSHATAGLFDPEGHVGEPMSMAGCDIDSGKEATTIIGHISNTILELIRDEGSVQQIGIAFPGPFDYKNGISAICNVGGKFRSTFGLHVRQALVDATGLAQAQFRFRNDAHCFAIGAWHKYGLTGKNVVFLTLGTGFGSAFYSNDQLLEKHPGIPENGAYFDQPFGDSIADDHFSTRWILQEYTALTGRTGITVRQMAADPDPSVTAVFNQFGKNLGSFLLPWLRKFKCDVLVLGGNISKASRLFVPALCEALEPLPVQPRIIICEDTEGCILSGAALNMRQEQNVGIVGLPLNVLRGEDPLLLPLEHQPDLSSLANYRILNDPSIQIRKGFRELARRIAEHRTVIIDGAPGVYWERFRDHLHQALKGLDKHVYWYDIRSCLKNASQEGLKLNGDLAQFFDPLKLELIRPEPGIELSVIYGTGAQLAGWEGLQLYVGIPYTEFQQRSRNYLPANDCGPAESAMIDQAMRSMGQMAETYLDGIHPLPEILIDEQRIDEITWIEGADLPLLEGLDDTDTEYVLISGSRYLFGASLKLMKKISAMNQSAPQI